MIINKINIRGQREGQKQRQSMNNSKYQSKYKTNHKTGGNFANQIMIGWNKKQEMYPLEKPTVYLPAYISVKLESIDQLSIPENRAGINLMIYFRIYFGQLGPQFAEKFCSQLQLASTREDQFRVKITAKQKEQRDEDEQNDQLNQDDTESEQQEEESANIFQKVYDVHQNVQTFVIRKLFQVELDPYTFLTPFQIHDLTLCLQLRTVKLKRITKDNKDQVLEVKLNLMSVDVHDQVMKLKCINYSDFKPFGEYDLAEGYLVFQNTIERAHKTLKQLFDYFPFKVNQVKKSEDKQPNKKQATSQLKCIQNKNFQYATFHFPIYRKPLVGFLSIYLPLWSLSFIILSLYYTVNWFGGRLIAIAALNLAFVPTIKIIRNQIPQTRHITLLQIGVYMQIISTFLLLMQNIVTRGYTSYQFHPYQNGFYLASLALFLIVLIGPITSFIIYSILKNNQKKDSENTRTQFFKSDGNEVFSDFEFKKYEWNKNQQAHHFFKTKYNFYKLQKVKEQIEKLIKKLPLAQQCTNTKQKKQINKLRKLLAPFLHFVVQHKFQNDNLGEVSEDFRELVKQVNKEFIRQNMYIKNTI